MKIAKIIAYVVAQLLRIWVTAFAGIAVYAPLSALAYAERGFRNITNSKKPITNAADVAGLKLRVMENDVYTATFKALDVNAVPMAWSDALTALQQGTIDGEENPINVIYSYKLWESQKYVTLDRHSYSTAIITMSNDLFKSLPEDVQTIFEESAQEAAAVSYTHLTLPTICSV